MNWRFALPLCCISFSFWSTFAYADEIRITPEPALSSDQFSILSQYKQYSEGSVDGAGKDLRITYSSSIALDAYVAVMNADESYNPADLYHFTVPAAKNGVVVVDVSALTTWTPFMHSYYLSFLSNAAQTDTQFSDMTILPGHFSDVILAAAKHLMRPEPYWVSSMHFLRGYKILNVSFACILGAILCVIVFFILIRKKALGIPAVLATVVIAFLLYDARVTADFTVLSVAHLEQWSSAHAYGEARDIYSVADALKKDIATQSTPSAVSVCFDSTDYYAKLIRYLVYPIPVTLTGAQLSTTTHVVVTHDLNWSESGDILHCGGINHAAKKIQTFNDGTVLFSLTK